MLRKIQFTENHWCAMSAFAGIVGAITFLIVH